ncbi:MAG: zf-HC2 domain-containing protein [Deltaproteobacteria bacterium]|nr:zf-HC2 domain-containing protein [Deltaproteobacteria bacterium]
MSCGFEEDGVAYLDGELPRERAEALAAHLPGCVLCTAQHAGLVRLREQVAALASAPLPLPSPGLRARVLAEVAGANGSPGTGLWAWLRGRLQPWMLAPALAGLAALAWLAWSPASPPSPSLDAPLPAWAAEATEEPAVLEAALVMDELDELRLGALETPEDLEVISALDELEQEGRP